jgi:hypothetical protein
VADALRVLADRVTQLDSRPNNADAHGDVDPDLAHFIRTMARITHPPGSWTERLPTAPASAADEIIDDCHLVQRLIENAPGVAVGPLVRAQQYWVATGRPAHSPPRVAKLDRAHFVEPTASMDVPASTKPFHLGLYTSTGTLGTFGMWWCYLQLHRGSTLFPLPWRVWSVRASNDANVLEITTAAEWVDLVSADPMHRNGFLYPDWRLLADRWDGIHMTVRAVAATQGMGFSLGRHVVAPAYWDVESTLWLRWAFTEVAPLPEFSNVPSPDQGPASQ